MRESFQTCCAAVLKSEGFNDGKRGFCDDPDDNGGPTLAGMTIANFCEFRQMPQPQKPWNPNIVAAMKQVTDDELYRYYYERKWLVVAGDDLPPGIDYATFDVCVLHGPGKAREFLRKAVGLPPKGKIDQAVIDAVNDHPDWDDVVRSIADSRRAHYDAIIAKNPRQAKYKKGWYARTARVEATACEMAPDSNARNVPAQLTDNGRPDETVEVTPDTKTLAESKTAQASSVSTVASVYSAQAVVKTELAAAQLEGSISWGKFFLGLLTSEVFLASAVAVIGAVFVLYERHSKGDISGIFKRTS